MPSPAPLLLGVLCSLSLAYSEKQAVVVNTTRGLVTGFHENLGADRTQVFYGEADVFLGIPYAQPPLGDLRFKLPKKICSYGATGIDATAYRDQCPQLPSLRNPEEPPLHSSDDCLYLNVISPSATGTTKYPVMVFIHGGSLMSFSADIYDYKGGLRNMVTRGVVLVTIQYRLSLLGFFTTYTEDFPANRGLFDQAMALKWVQEEIANFGGDPNQVTIFGQSAGGTSVSAQTMSPVSRGTFHRVIQQSGSVLLEFTVPNDPNGDLSQSKAQKICGFTNDQWKTGDYSALAQCLNAKTSAELVARDADNMGSGWLIALDGAFFPKRPRELALERPNYPVMIGDVTDEMATFLSQNIDDYNSSFARATVASTYPYLGDRIPLVSDIVQQAYMYTPIAADDHVGWFKMNNELFTNMYFSVLSRRDATWYLDNGNQNVFMYNFNHVDTVCTPKTLGGVPLVYHGSELCFLWMYPYDWTPANAAGRVTADDLRLADFMGTVWTNFAKQAPGTLPYDGWQPIRNREDFEFYRFDGVPGAMTKGFRSDGNVLFNTVLPNLVGEFPVESTDPVTMAKLTEVGRRILEQFHAETCHPNGGGSDTTSTQSTSTTVTPDPSSSSTTTAQKTSSSTTPIPTTSLASDVLSLTTVAFALLSFSALKN